MRLHLVLVDCSDLDDIYKTAKADTDNLTMLHKYKYTDVSTDIKDSTGYQFFMKREPSLGVLLHALFINLTLYLQNPQSDKFFHLELSPHSPITQ